MVEDRITDGRRIAQLLASEFDGRSDGALDQVAVANADPDVDPTPEGTRAYDVTVGGSTVASVLTHPESARVVVSGSADGAAGGIKEAVEGGGSDGVWIEGASGDDEPAIVVEHGAAVKGAVDALTALIDAGT
jgi:hypothetical protein